MATVGYLLGAGASAQCIPVVNGMAEDIRMLIDEIQNFNPYNNVTISGSSPIKDQVFEVVEVLEPLAEACDFYYSIDTYAKKLYLTDAKRFKKLKLDLCLYFSLRQALRNPDKRYDNFFSSIIMSKDTLPSKIKIMSWNYDFQIEKSFSEFIEHDEFDSLRMQLGMVSPNEWERFKKYYGKFNVLKLNGSARIETKDHKGYLFNSLTTSGKELAKEIVARYFEALKSNKYICELKFAWENAKYENLFGIAYPELEPITVLVIIGYSFPFFNREVDSRLFKMMPQLQKIYIQDLYPQDIEETMREFYSFQQQHKGLVEVVHKTNLNQFVFPKELDVTL
jgi:hypothetical protein